MEGHDVVVPEGSTVLEGAPTKAKTLHVPFVANSSLSKNK